MQLQYLSGDHFGGLAREGGRLGCLSFEGWKVVEEGEKGEEGGRDLSYQFIVSSG